MLWHITCGNEVFPPLRVKHVLSCSWILLRRSSGVSSPDSGTDPHMHSVSREIYIDGHELITISAKVNHFLMGLVQHTKERIFSLHRVLRVLCNSDDLGLSQPTVSALIKQTSQLLRQCTNSFVSPPVSVKLWKNKLHLYKLWDQLCLKLPVAELYVWYMVGCCGVFPNTGWH